MIPDLTEKLREFIYAKCCMTYIHTSPHIHITGVNMILKTNEMDISVKAVFDDGTKEHIYFSKSHTNNKTILIVADTPVGIDIETVRDNIRDGKEHILRNVEKRIVPYLGVHFSEILTIIWSCKESVFKSLGKYQPHHPGQISLQLENNMIIGSYGEKKTRVYLFQVDEYIMTIAMLIS